VSRNAKLAAHLHRHVADNAPPTETTTMTTSNGTLEDVMILPIRSRYTDGAWSSVRASFYWRFDGGHVRWRW